jgi:hypothetical protein
MGLRGLNAQQWAKLTTAERMLVEWANGVASHSTTALFECMARFDTTNLAKLEKGFPEQVEVWRKYKGGGGWWAALCARLEIAP